MTMRQPFLNKKATISTITTHPSKGYNGPLQGAILDWSGTCADIFVIAPAYAFVEVFRKFGVEISMQEARVPMGLRKDLHIQALTKMDSVREKRRKAHGKYPDQADVDAMFKDFIPMQVKCLPNYTKLIPGAAETVKTLREKYGLKIGNTTGFQRIMVDILLKDAAKQGYVPDVAVAGDEVAFPRPFPVHGVQEYGEAWHFACALCCQG
jgi:phosphonoacetaldehyde hydrolase